MTIINRSRCQKLNQNLSFEEFTALANRQPNLKGSWIYKVTQAIFDYDLKYPYPKFELEYHKECYFKTFRSAEKYIKKNKDKVYCSWILQIPCGITSEYEGYGAEWLYDQHGELLDYTITNGCFGKIEEQTFFGRPKSRQRFKVGDIVEVVTARSVHLAVLNLQIPDVEWCWERYKMRDEFGFYYRMDYSDDSAVVIDGPNYYCHDHVGALQLLKPRFTIPDDILADMRTWNERCKNEDDSIWLQTCEPYREERQKEKGENLGEFYQLELSLHFDEHSDIPHLHINDYYGLKIALCIDRPEYYDHDEYTGRLTANQIKDLYSHLTHTQFEKTRWWEMLRKWNEKNDNPKHILPLDTPLPNYSKLTSY